MAFGFRQVWAVEDAEFVRQLCGLISEEMLRIQAAVIANCGMCRGLIVEDDPRWAGFFDVRVGNAAPKYRAFMGIPARRRTLLDGWACQ